MEEKQALKLPRFPMTTTVSPFTTSEFKTFFSDMAYYKKDFQNIANILRIPVELLYGKAAIESGGRQFVKTKGGSSGQRSITAGFPETDNYVGLMQVGKAPVQQALQFYSKVEPVYSVGMKFKAPDDMRNAVLPIIKKYVPSYNPDVKGSAAANVGTAFNAAANYPEFNILMGATILWMLMANPRYADNGVIKIDKLVSAYNTGEGYSAYKQNYTDTAALISALPSFLSAGKVPETRNHILKLVGTNGAYDLLFNKKIIV